jgi:hypothetical protein
MDLVTSHRNHEWLRNLITDDDKWVLYINYARRHQWLSVWWGVKGVIRWETLPNGCTITADLYCQQLDRVAQKLKRKQDRIYFLHDNASPHVAKSTHEKLLKLRWVTIPRPTYSPD